MTYALQGTIEKALPDGRSVPMSDATIRVYRPKEDVSPEEIAARPKETFAVVDSQEVENRFERVGTAPLDDQGRYGVRLGEDGSYEGGPVAIHLHVDRVPAANDSESVQVALDLIQPRWREVTEEVNSAFLSRRSVEEARRVENWDHVISRQHWCAILEAFGVWVVCGQVTLCPPDTDQVEETTAGTSNLPVDGVTVRAKDRDIVQDDALGSDVTDANGNYCIYYRKRSFEKTPSPFGPIELVGGPDLYFEITDGGLTLLDENQQTGRTPGRENAERCEDVDLCVPRGDIPEDGDGSGITRVPTYWRSIGSQFEVPQQAGTVANADFDDYGYAGDDKFALYRTITMEGSAPVLYATRPNQSDQYVEYRFLVSESPTSNTGSASPQNFQPVGVGSSRFSDAFVDGVTVGEIAIYDQTAVGDATNPNFKKVTVNLRGGRGGHQNSAGWVSLKAAADEALNDRFGVDLATVRASGSNYEYLGWDSRNALFGIDTREFTTEPDVGSGSGGAPPAAGNSVSSQQEIDPERIAIRFEARTVDSTGTQVSPAGNSRKLNSGTTLNAAVINNNSEYVQFQVDDLTGDPCADLTGDVDISYTIYHPHLHGVELRIEKNTRTETLDDPTNEVSFNPGSPPGGNWDDSVAKNSPSDPQTVESLANKGQSIQNDLVISDPNASEVLNEDCAYRAVFRYKRRLHNGYDADHWNHQDSLFCWAPGGSSES